MTLPLVLFVDDDEDDIWVLEEIFSTLQWHCQLEKFRNGKSALSFLKNNLTPPVLIIIDYSLPDMNGLEVLSILRDLPNLNATWVILVSERFPISFPSNIEELGGNGFFSKPFTIGEWQTSLQHIITSFPPVKLV